MVSVHSVTRMAWVVAGALALLACGSDDTGSGGSGGNGGNGTTGGGGDAGGTSSSSGGGGGGGVGECKVNGAVCNGCINMECETSLTACNADASCAQRLTTFNECACAAQLANDADQLGQCEATWVQNGNVAVAALHDCVNLYCDNECID